MNTYTCALVITFSFLPTDFGPFVSQMIAYFPRLNILFGISMDGRSLVMSRNSGRKWVSTQIGVYRKLLNDEQDVINAIPIPWITKKGVFDRSTKGEECKAYGAENWHGMYLNG